MYIENNSLIFFHKNHLVKHSITQVFFLDLGGHVIGVYSISMQKKKKNRKNTLKVFNNIYYVSISKSFTQKNLRQT